MTHHEPFASAFVTVEVNGERYEREVEARRLLVHFLRDDLDLTGTHVGCDTTQCGACTVLFNGDAVKSCTVLAVQADGGDVVTIEGIGSAERPHPLQHAFIREQAAQCGYCVSGIIMSVKALLDRNSSPSDDEIKQALAGNLCRCGTHVRVLQAVMRAASGNPSAPPAGTRRP